MKKLLLILFSLVVISELAAQNSDYTDISALLENKIWNVQLPKGKQYAMEMEFRDAGWKYNPQIQISVVSGTKRSIFRQKNKTKRSKKKAAHNTYKAGAKG